MDLDDVESVDFNALGGADTITVNDLTGTDVDRGQPRPRRVGGAGDGQADNVIVNGTNGDDAIVVAGDAAGVSRIGLAAAGQHHRRRGRQRPADGQALAGDDVVDASAWRPARSSSRPTAATATTC